MIFYATTLLQEVLSIYLKSFTIYKSTRLLGHRVCFHNYIFIPNEPIPEIFFVMTYDGIFFIWKEFALSFKTNKIY